MNTQSTLSRLRRSNAAQFAGQSHPLRSLRQFECLQATARRRSRRGAMLFLVAVAIVFFIIAAAFSINVAWMQMVDTELRCATDCAARAGGQGLARGLTLDEAANEVQELAALNLVDGTPLNIRDQDIEFGVANTNGGQRYQFTPTNNPDMDEVNAVRVAGHRIDGPGSNAVRLPFTPFLSRDTFQASKFATATIQERDIVLVVDRSGSMEIEDAGVAGIVGSLIQRIDALKLAVGIFRTVIDETQGNEKLGLASYASESRQDCPLSFSYALFDTKIGELLPEGRTEIGGGIDDGVEILFDPGTSRPIATPVLIVMTDGLHNQFRDPEIAAQDAMAAHPRLKIYTITFSDGADQARMARVADIGNGLHYHADNTGELVTVFADVARSAGSILIE